MGKEGEIAAGRDAGGPLWHDLVEREEELSALEIALEEAGAGSGRFLFVEGAPGIGKTSLLQAVRTLAAEDGMRVLSARGSELERDFPYAIVQQLFDPLLRDPQMPRELLLEGSARAALEVFHPEPIARGAASTEAPPKDPFAAMHGLYWLTCNALDRGPLVLLIDDAQWADPASLRFIGFMQARLAELPLLIALAARMGESETNPLLARLSDDVASRPIRLGPLSAEAVSLLVRAATSDDADASFCIACRDASGGNPYILRELLVDLGARGMAPTAETAGGVASLAPASVVRSVLLRLAPFGPEGTALARAVATLGDSTELRHAAALAGLAHDDAGRVAQELARVGLLVPERALSFAHPVTRAAVYADMRPVQRAELHARAAELLAAEGAETDAVAAHLLAVEPSGDSAVVRTLRDAAARALARGGAEAAVTYLRRALAEPPPPEAMSGVLLELGAAGFRAGIPDPTIDAFGRGFASCTDPVERARFARPYSLTLWAVGQSGRAYDLIERASKEAATRDPELALRLAAEALALSRLDPTLLPRGYEQARAPELRLFPGDTAGERLMLAALAYTDTWSGGSASESGELAERALAGELALGGESAEWLAFHEGVYALIASDRLQVARATLETALDFARLRGSALGLVSCLGFRSHLALRSGLVTAAEADAREAVAIAREQGWLMATPWILAFLIDALVERGELAEAEQQLDASRVGAAIPSHRITVLHLLFSRARLRLAQGNADAALGDLGELAARKRQWGIVEVSGTPGAALEASALASLGKRREAVARSQEALREARAWGTLRDVGIALRARGIAEEGQAGIDVLRDATDMLEGSPASLEYARAQTDLGAALRRARKRAEARVPLRAALERARRCGAHALARRAHEELAATGERLPRPVPIEPGSLTPSERRVAELAARGMTNREIAQTLFLTVRTVEAHLTATYRKLDIDSRRLLGRYLTEPATQQSPSRSTRGIATSR